MILDSLITVSYKETTEAYKLYCLSGQIDFCYYNKIIEKYQKNGLYYGELINGTKRIWFIKDNNFDDFGLTYNCLL